MSLSDFVLILVMIALCIELYKSACIHKSAVSKIFEIKFFGLQKWIFRCTNAVRHRRTQEGGQAKADTTITKT